MKNSKAEKKNNLRALNINMSHQETTEIAIDPEHYQSPRKKIETINSFDKNLAEKTIMGKNRLEPNTFDIKPKINPNIRASSSLKNSNDPQAIDSRKILNLQNNDQFNILSFRKPNEEYENRIVSLRLARIQNQENSFVNVKRLTSFEKYQNYNQNLLLSSFRYKLMYYILKLQVLLGKVLNHFIFELMSLMVVIINTILYIIDGSITYGPNEVSLSDKWELTFLIIFTSEIALKLFANGTHGKNVFYKSSWNLFDMIIVVISWLSYLEIGNLQNLSFFRSLRMLRVYKILSSNKTLKRKISNFLSSINYFLEIVFILFFFYSIFAIIGLKLFSGVLERRCVDPSIPITPENVTGKNCLNDMVCPANMICQGGFSNPSLPLTNFNNYLTALFMSFQISFLEGWYSLLLILVKAFPIYLTPLVYLYFIFVIFIGNVFILNLVRAIIIIKYNKSEKTIQDIRFNKRATLIEQEDLNLLQLKVCKYFTDIYYLRNSEAFELQSKKSINRSKYEYQPLQDHSFNIQSVRSLMKEPDESINDNKIVKPEKESVRQRGSKRNSISRDDYRVNESQLKEICPDFRIYKYLDKRIRPKEFSILSGREINSLRNANYSNKEILIRSQNNISMITNSALKDPSANFSIDLLLYLNKKTNIKKSAYHKVISKWKKENSKMVRFHISNNSIYPSYYVFDSRSDVFNSASAKDTEQNATFRLGQNKAAIKIRYITDLLLYERANKLINNVYNKDQNYLNLNRIESEAKKLKYKDLLSVYSIQDILRLKYTLERKMSFFKFLDEVKRCASVYYHFFHGFPIINYNLKFKTFPKKATDNSMWIKEHVIISRLNKISFSINAIAKFFAQEFESNQTRNPIVGNDSMSNHVIYVSIFEFDESIQEKLSRVWSGFDVFSSKMNIIEKMNDLILHLNQENYDLWLKSFVGKIVALRGKARIFMLSSQIDYLIIFVVIMNTLVLSLYGIISIEQEYILETFNFSFTIFFMAEFVLKLFALGIVKYFKYLANWLDALIVLVSIIDLFTANSGSSSTAIRSLRLFRILRVVRIVRLLRYLRFINVIMQVLLQSWAKLKYILIIMITFLLIFSLIGFGLFNNTLDAAYPDGYKGLNFDSLYESFIFIFNILTMDNWDNGISILLLSTQYRVISLIFYIIWTFLGSIVVLNFFIAAILEGYTEPSTIDIIKELSKEEKAVIIIFNKKINDMVQNDWLLKKADRITKHFKSINIAKLPFDQKIKKSFMRNLVMQQNYELDEIDEPKENDEIDEDDVFEEFKVKFSLPKLKKTQHQVDDRKMCPCSLYLFPLDSAFRVMIIGIVRNFWFQGFMICAISMNCILLIVLSYKNFLNDDVVTTLMIFDYIFNLMIILEVLMKIIAYGLAFCENAYLKDNWGLFDFIIVIFLIADMIVSNTKYETNWLKIVTITRIFRLISHVGYFKSVLSSLYSSLSAVGNVLIIILIYFLIYGILGVSFLRNKMNYCADSDGNVIYNKNKFDCLNEKLQWQAYDWNFDNIINALITLFVVALLDNWQVIMLSAADANDETYGAVYRTNPYIYIYFVSFVCFVVFIIFNLGIGVIYVQYQLHEKERREKENLLNEEEHNFIHYMRMLLHCYPENFRKSVLRTRFGRFMIRFYKNKIYKVFMRVLVIASVIILAMSYEGMPDKYQLVLELIQTFINFFFVLEFFIKFYLQGLKYFFNEWNLYEFSLVILSIIDITLFILMTYDPNYEYTYKIYKLTRLARIIRLYQIINLPFLKQLDQIVRSLIITIPLMMNIIVILVFVYLIFSMFAVTAFSNANIEEFENFGHAFLNMFRFSTGESWSLVMWQLNKLYPFWGTAFFITFIFITAYLLFNMFTLIMIEQFENIFVNSSSSLNLFNEYQKGFDKMWNIFAEKYGGDQIKENELFNLFITLKMPLGFNTTGDKLDKIDFYNRKNYSVDVMKSKLSVDNSTILSKISNFKIPVDKNHFVKYHYVFYSSLKLAYELSDRRKTKEKNQLLKEYEKKTFEGLSSMRINKLKPGLKYYAAPMIKQVYIEFLFFSWLKKSS